MSGWISIDASPQPLTEGEQRVKDLLDQGYGYVYIAALLRMSHETTKDMIYEIRKKEGLRKMSKGVPISDDIRSRIFELHDQGNAAPAIAKVLGCGTNTVYRALKKPCTDPDKPKKPAKINAEFEAAVDSMIAEQKAADADEKSANADAPQKLPGYVSRAIEAGIFDLEDKIQTRHERIDELRVEIEELQKDLDGLKAWQEAHR